MTTAELTVILDDNAPDFKYSGGEWKLSTFVQWYSKTSNFPGFANATTFGSFTLEFEGMRNQRLSNILMFFHVLQELLSHSLGLRPQIPSPSPNSQLLVSMEGRRITLPTGLKPSPSHPVKPMFSCTNPQHCLREITTSLFHI